MSSLQQLIFQTKYYGIYFQPLFAWCKLKNIVQCIEFVSKNKIILNNKILNNKIISVRFKRNCRSSVRNNCTLTALWSYSAMGMGMLWFGFPPHSLLSGLPSTPIIIFIICTFPNEKSHKFKNIWWGKTNFIFHILRGMVV